MSQTLEQHATDAGLIPGEWEPVSREPAPEESKANGKAATPSAKQAPQQVVIAIDGGAIGKISEAVDVLVAGQAALVEGQQAVTEALKAHATMMETWLKRIDRVMSAPRSVTLKRSEDGFAQSAISEVLAPKAKG